MHQFIDNLNVAYVAFTRAKHELICMIPKPDKEPECVEKIGSLSALLFNVFSNKTNGVSTLSAHFNGENNEFRLGEEALKDKEISASNNDSEHITNYRSCSPIGRLRLRNISTDSWLNNQEMTDSKLNLGNIMHEVLQNIRIKNDSEAAINNCIREGKINNTEAEKVREMLNAFWQQPETEDWFSEANTVLNEAVILTPGAKLYRPDRVVINGNRATVIDYKFGETEKESHLKQVKNYMQLISEMGYNVSGYLSYITLGKNIDVMMS